MKHTLEYDQREKYFKLSLEKGVFSIVTNLNDLKEKVNLHDIDNIGLIHCLDEKSRKLVLELFDLWSDTGFTKNFNRQQFKTIKITPAQYSDNPAGTYNNSSNKNVRPILLAEKTIKSHPTKMDGKIDPENNFIEEKNSTRERESSPISTIISAQMSYDKKARPNNNNIPSLSVWKTVCNNIDSDSDEEGYRTAYYMKHQRIIKEIIDVHHVFSINKASTLAQDVGIKHTSTRVISALLDNLYTDKLLDYKIVKCGARHPATVYFTKQCDTSKLERYINKLKDREQVKNGLAKMSYDKKARPIQDNEKYLDSLKQQAKERGKAQSEGYTEGKKELQEKEKQESDKKLQQPSNKNVRPIENKKLEDSFNLELYRLVQKMSKDDLDKQLLRKNFRDPYEIMLKQKAAMGEKRFSKLLKQKEIQNRVIEEPTTIKNTKTKDEILKDQAERNKQYEESIKLDKEKQEYKKSTQYQIDKIEKFQETLRDLKKK